VTQKALDAAVQAFKEAARPFELDRATRLAVDPEKELRACIQAAILTYEAYKEAEFDALRRVPKGQEEAPPAL
jgi:hypothetical protein